MDELLYSLNPHAKIRTISGRMLDLTNTRYGRLTPLAPTTLRRSSQIIWLCRCSCGNHCLVATDLMRSGKTKSCGCLKAERILPPGQAAFNVLLLRYKANARRRGRKWSLTRTEFHALTKQPCHYCGAQPVRAVSAGRTHGDYIFNGIDRKDSSKDYTTDNVATCCWRCNQGKSTMSESDFIEMCLAVTAHSSLPKQRCNRADQQGAQ